MAYCPYCGSTVAASANFCPKCGAQMGVAAGVASVPVTAVPVTAAAGGYSVILLGQGACTKADGKRLIASLTGYTQADALDLINLAPTVVAQYLTESQAYYLAQAMAEYGLEVTVFDGRSYRNVPTNYNTVFDTAGNLLSGVASALGLIGAGNLITRTMFRPYTFVGARPAPYRVTTARRHMPLVGGPRPLRAAPPPPPRAPRTAGPAPRAARPIAGRPVGPLGPGPGGRGGRGGRGPGRP